MQAVGYKNVRAAAPKATKAKRRAPCTPAAVRGRGAQIPIGSLWPLPLRRHEPIVPERLPLREPEPEKLERMLSMLGRSFIHWGRGGGLAVCRCETHTRVHIKAHTRAMVGGARQGAHGQARTRSGGGTAAINSSNQRPGGGRARTAGKTSRAPSPAARQ